MNCDYFFICLQNADGGQEQGIVISCHDIVISEPILSPWVIW